MAVLVPVVSEAGTAEAVLSAAGMEDSLVTFELTPTADGGTWFKLTHAPMAVPAAANSNGPRQTVALAA